jgi:hypothetical protein
MDEVVDSDDAKPTSNENMLGPQQMSLVKSKTHAQFYWQPPRLSNCELF